MSIENIMILTILLPTAAAVLLLLIPSDKISDDMAARISVATLVVTLLLSVQMLFRYLGSGVDVSNGVTVMSFTENLTIRFRTDKLGAFFMGFIPAIWLLSGIFSTEYLHHENNRKRFWGFYLLTLAALNGLSLSANIITMYLFFEIMTLVSTPLVLHTQTHEAIMAGLKYLMYSMFGAFMALFGIFFFCSIGGTADFVAGGIIPSSLILNHPAIFRLSVFLCIVGFGVKAGMFPLHAWLPTAHPVAPAPASAVLSAIIVKGGVLAIIRSVYYVAGTEFIAGTWVQYTWLVLALITVFMGSMLAFKEPLLKKRLAYSSVSQASYILLGLAALNSVALTGALLHVLFHAFIKTALFLVAGAIIYKKGTVYVQDMRGVGKEMPITIWCWTFASLGLIGIPPMCGFISKWYLAVGLLDTEMRVFSWLGPVILLVSALLTAGYLLPITINGFFPGRDFDYKSLKKAEPTFRMTVPLIILALSVVLMGLLPGGITEYLTQTAAQFVK